MHNNIKVTFHYECSYKDYNDYATIAKRYNIYTIMSMRYFLIKKMSTFKIQTVIDIYIKLYRRTSDAKPIIFLEGVQFTVCPIIMIPKNIPPMNRNSNSVHLGYLIKTYLYAVFLFLLFFRQSFVSVAEGIHCTDVKEKRFSG